MGKEYKYEKQCRYCGKELTSETTSRNFINDQNYICYGCATGRMSSGGYRIRNLEQVYDPNKNKIHGEIHRKAQLHTDQVELREEAEIILSKPKEKKYPSPKGRSIIIRHREVECVTCHTVLTTTNAYPERVKVRGSRICKYCEYKQKHARDTDPLYEEKRKLEILLHKLYARRRLKQFTWEYVEQRFAKTAEPKTIQVDKEEYDKTVKLFGEEYATKRYRPKTTISLQMSFGDLSTREGCKRLLALFEYELDKSRYSGKRKKEKHEAIQYLKMFDPDFNARRSDKNINSDPDGYNTYDKYAEEAYTKTTYKPKIWDPYNPEVT